MVKHFAHGALQFSDVDHFKWYVYKIRGQTDYSQHAACLVEVYKLNLIMDLIELYSVGMTWNNVGMKNLSLSIYLQRMFLMMIRVV